THKGVEAARVGAVGMILANDENSGSGIQADPHVVPSSYSYNQDISDNWTKFLWYPVASISKVVTQMATKPAPFIAFFSARGPNPVEPTILKVYSSVLI
ncbi:subtilisin-like protease-like, partial [Trifolium medium]|nr:subtilisin-like protease-like [Trifolium medium]